MKGWLISCHAPSHPEARLAPAFARSCLCICQWQSVGSELSAASCWRQAVGSRPMQVFLQAGLCATRAWPARWPGQPGTHAKWPGQAG
eukprot:356116-Chlamydomonas_euryale.AAC.6